MYQVNIGTDILYYPGSDDAVIYDSELNEEVGLAGEFSFKVPSNNPQYSKVSSGALVTIIKNGKEFWRGEIREVKTDFAKVASVYAVEDLAWLGEEYLFPASVTNQTYSQRFQTAISSYNANRGSDRQFTVGYLSNVTASANCKWITEYEWSILDSLRNCICDASSNKGYIRVRRVTSGGTVTRYIDIVPLSQYGVTANQPIEYGYNLLDYVKDMDYGNLVNVLTPYGDETDTVVYGDYSARIQGDTITNAASVSVYGRHAKAVVFDGVSTKAALDNLASSYLSRYCQPQLTMEVKAVDLAEIESVDEIKIGDSVRIIAEPFAIDQYLYLTQIKRDIQNLDKNSITMSGHVTTGRTITSQMNTATNAIEEAPTKWSILESAKKNALSMLLSETQGGHVVLEYDANNKYVEAISICDAETIAASTKRWRWSQNGFGYMKRNSISDPWTELAVAIDINGNITANAITTGTLNGNNVNVTNLNASNISTGSMSAGFITSGTMSANRISGGSIDATNVTITNLNASNISSGSMSCDRLNGGIISGQSISGSTISGGSITGSTIKSYRDGSTSNGYVEISGGDLLVESDADNFFKVRYKNDHDVYVTLGPQITVNWGSSPGDRVQQDIKYLGLAVQDAYDKRHP